MAAIIRYNPWFLLNDIQEEINQSFDRNAKDQKSEKRRGFDADIDEEANQYIIRADLPGVNPKDIQISVEKNTLTIKAERIENQKKEEKTYRYYERFEGTFFRQFTLPEGIDSEKIQASGKNGVLELILPKMEEKIAKKIEVKVQ